MKSISKKSEGKIVPLNSPKLEIDGIEELEERLEMALCGRDCCSSSFYGRC